MVKLVLTRGVCLVVCAVLLLALVQATASASVEALDDAGHRIRLDTPARRIVSLSPHLTELLFQAGAGAMVVGAAAFSDYPDEARAIPRIGDARGLDTEAILRARPDLVVAWSSGNSGRAIDRLRRLGMPIFESEPSRLDDISHTLRRLGVLAGTTAVATARAAAFDTRLAELAAANREGPSQRVFYQIWDRPLLTINDRHLLTHMLSTCGVRNIFGHLKTLTAAPSREAVLLADPDVIVVASNAPDALASWTKWRSLRAVRDQRVFAVDPQLLHRPTLRVLDGVASLCSKLRRD